MLKVGDRVSRQLSPNELRKYGVIVEKYKTRQGIGFTPFTMFAIKWDNIEKVERGYLEQYLQKEE